MLSFNFTPPGGYQFQSNVVNVPLGAREGFFVVEARRGDVGEQVWINRSRIGLISKETPSGLLLYGADLGTGMPLARMRVQFVVNRSFVTAMTDADGIVRWNRSPRPVFALAQWGNSYAFLSLLPQPPLPATIVGVRTDSAVVHAGDVVARRRFCANALARRFAREHRQRARFAALRRDDDRAAARAARRGRSVRHLVRGAGRMRRRASTRCWRRPAGGVGGATVRRRRERRAAFRSTSAPPATARAIRARTFRCSFTRRAATRRFG